MYKRVFIDANIFIDANDSSRKNFDSSSTILRFLVKNGVEIYTSCDLITTIYYILSKNDKKKALLSIEKINVICKVMEFSNKEISAVCVLMKENEKYKDLEDSLQYLLAKKSNCELIISNDKKFYSEDIKLLSSEMFCKNFI